MSVSTANLLSISELFSDYIELSDKRTVLGITSDSRDVEPGYIFFALQGLQSHGLDYLSSVLKNQPIAIVIDKDDGRVDDNLVAMLEDLNILLVRIVLLKDKIGILASKYYKHPSQNLRVVAVTGTDGKTSVTHFLANALDYCGYQTAVLGTISWGLLNAQQPSELTTPDPINLQRKLASLLEQGAEFVFVELSSHALDQGRANGTILDAAILTNLGRDHLDYHLDKSAYAAAKRRLFSWPELSCVILNKDDEFGQQIIKDLMDTSCNVVISYGFGMPEKARDCGASNIVSSDSGIQFDLNLFDHKDTIKNQLVGQFNVYNMLAASSYMQYIHIDSEMIAASMRELSPVKGRMELIKQTGKPAVVIDFAHTPESLRSALLTIAQHCDGKLNCVFGCGGDRDSGKRALMGRAANDIADRVIVTNDNPRTEDPDVIIKNILDGIDDKSKITVLSDRQRAISEAITSAAEQDWVLVAGKGHEEYQLLGSKKMPFSDRKVAMAVLGGEC